LSRRLSVLSSADFKPAPARAVQPDCARRRTNARAQQLALCLWSLLAWSVCAHVKAFQAPARFIEDAETGGSEGRFFTGSPQDRYTCKVCHTLGQPPRLQITGLPVSGYLPGQTYQIAIDWDDALKSIAFNLEMTDPAGRAVGVFSVPSSDQLTPADLCPSTGVPGVVTTPAGQRTMALLSECGARQATFRWTAPTASATGAAATEVWFNGSLVSSDGDGTVFGDSVEDISRIFGMAHEQAPAAATITAGCQISAGAGAVQHRHALALSVLGALYWRRRRRRRDP
jgi:hypothetical protein